ncbi:Ig-like domain-containing protein [Prescottella agglutinans]|uniref:Ig-like domain-containing protein n=1 Tax=Prescottella agglutinans TaxID=1644129 RepID=UPI001F4E730B|nr:Ig-like domain-containing protein [Prescottella agglutinans]
MGLSALRRLATPVIAGAAAVGLLVAGSGPAFAADPPPSSNQGASDNVKFKKEVIGSNVLHRGDTVTYKSTIWVDSGVERYIPKFRDVPPAGFALVAGSPKVTYLGATNKATFTNESDGGVSAKCSGSGCNAFGNGFIVKSGQNVTLEASYRVPDNFAFGTYDSGVLLDVWAFNGNPKGANPFNVNVRVEELATTTTLQAPASAMTGQPVTLTATVNPSNAAGQVQFKDGAANIGSPVTPVNGVATLPHAFGSAGAHSVTAEFIPGAGYFGSTSAAQTVTVTDPDVSTTLAVSVPGTATTGSSVDLSATVSPSNAQGSVQFKDNGSNIGAPVTVANGAAVLPHSFASAGAHSITAEFTGAAGFTNSTAAAHEVTVTDPDVATSLTVQAPASAETGTSVDLTATVSPANAAGTVQFTDNGAPIGAPVTVANGVAVLPHSFDSAGTHSIGASFTGAAGFTNSTAAAHDVTVTDPDVQTSLTVQAPATAETGAEVSLSAQVSPANAQGSVQFSVNGAPVGAPVTVVNGAASLPHTFDAAGSFQVTAEFTGAAGFTNSSAAAQSVTVTDPDVETSLTVSVPGTATTGTSVDLTATVDPSNAQGTVQFTDNGAPIGNPVAVVNGVATLPHAFTAAGERSIGASFTGGPGFTDSSAGTNGSITVSDPVQQTALSVAAPATAETGQQVDLSATVTPSNAQGTVQFSVNGAPVAAPVAVSAGTATLPYAFDAAGSFEVTAEFTGATGFTNSTASGQTVTVTDPVIPDIATSTLIGVPPTATTGVETTLSVTVNAQSATPTGSVQFQDNGSPIGSAVVLANGSGSLAHTFSTVGTHQITAVYTPDAGFAGSTSTQRPIVVSAPNPVDVPSSVVMTSTASAPAGTPFKLAAKVIGAPVLPGTVQFYDGGVALGQPVPVVNGIAELEHTFDQSGPRQIHAVYSGGPGVQGSTSEVQVLDVAETGGPACNGSMGSGSLCSLGGLRFGS